MTVSSIMFEQLRGSSSGWSGNDGTERYGLRHASFNVETTHSIGLSVIV